MKRILAVSLIALAVPLAAGHPAGGQTTPAPVAACPSDAPIAAPMGDVDQFVAFDSHGCPVAATAVPTVVASLDGAGPAAGAEVSSTAPEPSAVPQPLTAPAPVEDAGESGPGAIVTIPVEDGFVVTTGEAEAEAAARPKPADYSERLEADYCAAVPWKCNAEVESFTG